MFLPKRAGLVLVLIVLSSLTVWAGGQPEPTPEPVVAEETSTYPLSVTDGLGNVVSILKKPARIASLTLFTDEVLFDLVDPERLSVITTFAGDAAMSNVADRADLVADQLDLNVETLISIYPDIIFVANWSDPAKVEQLRNAGLVVYAVNTPTTIERIQAEIATLATIVGEEAAGASIVAEMNSRLSAVSDVVAGVESKRSLDYNTWGTSNGDNTTWSAVLAAAGVTNAVAGYDLNDYGQVNMSKELLVELDPDVVFLPGWVWGDPEGADAFEAQVMTDPALVDIRAIKEGNVFQVPEYLKSTFSHHIVATVEYVAALVYPDLF